MGKGRVTLTLCPPTCLHTTLGVSLSGQEPHSLLPSDADLPPVSDPEVRASIDSRVAHFDHSTAP